jgi:hypothetical protein
MTTHQQKRKKAMPPSHDMQSPMRQRPKPVANGASLADECPDGFDLRDTLAATVVRELSFAEFRAALEKSGKRFA